MMMHVRLILALSLVVMLFGCTRLTVENFSKIRMGTAYTEVVDILGKPDSCSDALFVKSCIWGNEKKNITVNFAGDKAIFFTASNIR